MEAASAIEAEKENSNVPCGSRPNTPEIEKRKPEVTYNWVDVTRDFFEATKELKVGELLHDDMFGLFEAMSAIEMMDPKMDAGMMCNRGNKKVMNFEQAVKAGKLKLGECSTEEQIGIIDATLSCLVTWLEGHSLVQTVFTNLYLHKPCMIEDRCIKAFSICILKFVDIIRDFVNKALVFEEEDFQPVVYSFKLASDVSEARVVGMMKEVEDELQRRVKNTRSKQGEDWDEATQTQHHGAMALYSRIKFCRLFYQALRSFAKKECTGVDSAQKCLASCCELLGQLQTTTHLGIQPAVREENTNRADYPTIIGFEPLVNQRLLPPTFPRYIKIKGRQEAMVYLENLINRLRHICQITTCTSFHFALDFFMEFSKQCPCVLSRSVLQLLYLPQSNKVFGTQSMTEVLRDSVRNFICPPALAPRSTLLNNPQAKEYVDSFLSHCVRPFCSLVHITGHNRARQRDKLAHILEELANLQDEADKVDVFLHGLSLKSDFPRTHLACFGTWILYHTLRVMIQYVLSGFELELYNIHEYQYIFWYLYEFLYGWMVSALSTADRFLFEQESIAEQQKGRNAKKNKNKKKKVRPHGKETTLYQALQNLCGGYCKALVGLDLDNKLRRPSFEFDCEQVRYEHRFAPFGSVMTPPPVQYQQYKEMTDLTHCENKPTSNSMYLAACKYFHQAKSLLENVANPTEEVGSLTKVAKTNFVVTKLLLGGHKKDCKDAPEFDFASQKIFPIIKFV